MVLKPTVNIHAQTIDLNGQWLFALDPDDKGKSENWQSSALPNTIAVPASFAEQGYGHEPASRLLGGWIQAHEYEGAAWYRLTIEIPVDWQKQVVELILRGVRWRSEVWLDDVYVGLQESLSTPHRYNLTDKVKAGSSYNLTIRVDNRMIYPLQESHINSCETATRWGGITGGIELIAKPLISIANIQCLPNVADKRFDFQIAVSNSASDLTLEVNVTDPQSGDTFTTNAPVVNGTAALSITLGAKARLWWDSDPFLYQAQFTLRQNDTVLDVTEKRLGLREIAVQGKQILLNGSPIFLSGYVDCCIFPLTGYPSWDIEHYRRQFRIAKSYGFNHVRLHSWTAPEPFFDAADEIGMLVQSELPHWSRYYDYAEVPAPLAVQNFLMSEVEAIVTALHLHPSYIMFSNGNELLGSAAGHPEMLALIERGRELDSTRLYTDNTGFGRMPAPQRKVDFFIQSCNWHPPKKIYDAASADTTQDFSEIMAMAAAPVIGHEHGQFTMYVRPSEAEKYTGVMRPTWLEGVETTLQAKGLESRLDDYIQASGTHILRTYKENIERARRTRGLSGLQLLDIRDFPGQGHATTGILDMFWDSKGLVEPETFAQFNGAVVLLTRKQSPTFWTGHALVVDVEVSNFGREIITDGVLHWELRDRQRKIVLNGSIEIPDAVIGEVTHLGQLSIPTDDDNVAHSWELILHVGKAQNSWHFWSYPYPQAQDYNGVSTRINDLRHVLTGADFSDDFNGTYLNWSETPYKLKPTVPLAIAERLSLRLLQYLHDGGNVWLTPNLSQLYDAVRTRYLPPFWSYLHFPDNVSSVMGTIIHPHPALANFPHDGYSDWQWYHIVNDTPAICLDSVPFIQPIMEVVDNFNRAKRLAYAFEARVGTGKLFVSTWRLHDGTAFGRPEARFLLGQIIDYLRSDHFAPTSNLSVGQVLGLFKLTNGFVVDFE
jgi:beta-galactosidase